MALLPRKPVPSLEFDTVGYGVSIEKARQWGLYVSTSRGMTSAGIEEPALFAEPGIVLDRKSVV